MTKIATLILFLQFGAAYAKPIAGLNDYGVLLSPSKFSNHCIITDPGLSGSSTIDVYSHGQVDCNTVQKLYSDTYTHAREFLSSVYNYNLNSPAAAKTLVLRILTQAELNNPDNFSQTDKKCMYNRCDSGVYYGRTFYAETSSNINVYVVYNSLTGKYSFVSTLKHELMHAILYRYRWTYLLGNNEEHALIDKFLAWKRR